MKTLQIRGENLKVKKGSKSFEVNGKNLEEIICERLPKDMELYEDYLANINVTISIHDNGELITVKDYVEEENQIKGD